MRVFTEYLSVCVYVYKIPTPLCVCVCVFTGPTRPTSVCACLQGLQGLRLCVHVYRAYSAYASCLHTALPQCAEFIQLEGQPVAGTIAEYITDGCTREQTLTILAFVPPLHHTLPFRPLPLSPSLSAH